MLDYPGENRRGRQVELLMILQDLVGQAENRGWHHTAPGTQMNDRYMALVALAEALDVDC